MYPKKLVAKFISRLQHHQSHSGQQQYKWQHNHQAEPWIEIALTEEAKSKAVNHVKNRIEVRNGLPELRQ